jgi:hypothetical protein
MMAFDSRSTPEPRSLSDSTLASIREAVLQVWNDPQGAEPVLQSALAQTVDEARTRALRAEEVIVAFKGLLASLPELNSPVRRLEAARLRERLITACIKAYYNDAAP